MQDDGVFLNPPPNCNALQNLSPQSASNQVDSQFLGTPENSPINTAIVRTPEGGINQSFIFPLSQPRNPTISGVGQLSFSPDQSNVTPQNSEQSNLSPVNVSQSSVPPLNVSSPLIGNQLSSLYGGHNIPLLDPVGRQPGQPHREAVSDIGQQLGLVGGTITASDSHALRSGFQGQSNPVGPFLSGGMSATFQFNIEPSSSPEWPLASAKVKGHQGLVIINFSLNHMFALTLS